jgi:hypothetical protein
MAKEKIAEVFGRTISVDFKIGRFFSPNDEALNKEINGLMGQMPLPTLSTFDPNPPYGNEKLDTVVENVSRLRNHVEKEIEKKTIQQMAVQLKQACKDENATRMIAAYEQDTGKKVDSIDKIPNTYFEEQVISSFVFKYSQLLDRKKFPMLDSQVIDGIMPTVNNIVMRKHMELSSYGPGEFFGGTAVIHCRNELLQKNKDDFSKKINNVLKNNTTTISMLNQLQQNFPEGNPSSPDKILGVDVCKALVQSAFLINIDPAKKQMFYDACFRLHQGADPQKPSHLSTIAGEVIKGQQVSPNEQARQALKNLQKATDAHYENLKSKGKDMPSHILEVRKLISDAAGQEAGGSMPDYNKVVTQVLKLVNDHSKKMNLATSSETKSYNNNILKNMGIDINETSASLLIKHPSMKDILSSNKVPAEQRVMQAFDRFDKSAASVQSSFPVKFESEKPKVTAAPVQDAQAQAKLSSSVPKPSAPGGSKS